MIFFKIGFKISFARIVLKRDFGVTNGSNGRDLRILTNLKLIRNQKCDMRGSIRVESFVLNLSFVTGSETYQKSY